MQQYYFYVPSAGMFFPECPIYKVEVGESKREQLAWRQLVNHAHKRGHFLKPVCRPNEIDMKSRVINNTGVDGGVCYERMLIYCSVMDLWSAIANNSLPSLESPKSIRDAHARLTHALNPIYFVRERSDRDERYVLTYPRKNLSPSGVCEVCDELCSLRTKCTAYYVAALAEHTALPDDVRHAIPTTT